MALVFGPRIPLWPGRLFPYLYQPMPPDLPHPVSGFGAGPAARRHDGRRTVIGAATHLARVWPRPPVCMCGMPRVDICEHAGRSAAAAAAGVLTARGADGQTVSAAAAAAAVGR